VKREGELAGEERHRTPPPLLLLLAVLVVKSATLLLLQLECSGTLRPPVFGLLERPAAAGRSLRNRNACSRGRLHGSSSCEAEAAAVPVLSPDHRLPAESASP